MFIGRNPDGTIYGKWTVKQWEGQEELPDDHPDLLPSLGFNRNICIAKTYADVDAIYADAVGNRAPEYEQAEQAALAYQAAGYTGAASSYVADYAAAAGITNRQSADIIIARAAGLRAAAQSMRSQRFVSQKAMRDATTQAGLDVAVAAWDAFITQVRASLGL